MFTGSIEVAQEFLLIVSFPLEEVTVLLPAKAEGNSY
jgi:hypothetical protein